MQQHDSGLTCEALEQRYATRPQEEIEAAFNDLCADLLLLLERLVGREMALRLAGGTHATASRACQGM